MPIEKLKEAAAVLESLEEAIIRKLIDRVQFRLNARIYEPGKSGFPNEYSASLFDVRLRYQEEMDSLFGRYTVPEERPCNRDLPPPRRNYGTPETGLRIDSFDLVNLMPQILRAYLALIPRICQPGSDGQYGSSVEHDVYALQTLGRRIHYGSFYVAECKYQADPGSYRDMIEAGNKAAIMSALTRPEVEANVIRRAREKAEQIQNSDPRTGIVPPPGGNGPRTILPPGAVSDFYRDTIIPLTKEGEILYLMNRRRS
jgi:chorismate mutase